MPPNRRSTRKRKGVDENNNKPVSKKKKRKKASSVVADSKESGTDEDVVVADESGKDEYLKLATEYCLTQNEDLGVAHSKAKTGSNYESQKRYDFILSNFLVLDRYKKADDKGKLEMKDEYKLCLLKMKSAWKYQYRLKWYGNVAKVQKPSFECNKRMSKLKNNKDKRLSVAQKYYLMNEDEWMDIVPCDSYECFKFLNDLHHKEIRNYSHHKGYTLFKHAQDISFGHNVTVHFCSLIANACPLCKSKFRVRKKKDSPMKEIVNQVEESDLPLVAGAVSKLVQYGIVRLSRSLGTNLSHNFDVIVVAYLNNTSHIDFFPMEKDDVYDIGGKLIGSFMSNEYPSQVQRVTGETYCTSLTTTTDSIFNYVNTFMMPKTHQIVSINDSTSSLFFGKAVKLLQDTFAFKNLVNCFVHRHVALCYIQTAINHHQSNENDVSAKWVVDNFFQNFISSNSQVNSSNDQDIDQPAIDEQNEEDVLPDSSFPFSLENEVGSISCTPLSPLKLSSYVGEEGHQPERDDSGSNKLEEEESAKFVETIVTSTNDIANEPSAEEVVAGEGNQTDGEDSATSVETDVSITNPEKDLLTMTKEKVKDLNIVGKGIMEEKLLEDEGEEYSSLVPLVNALNQCYMIATIQLLTRVLPIWKWLGIEDETSLPLINPLSKSKILRTGTLMIGGLIHSEFQSSLDKNRDLNPVKMDTFNEARKASLSSFHNSNQEDAGEFLLQLLNNFSETNEESKRLFEKNMTLHFKHTKKCCDCGDNKLEPTDYATVLPVPMNSSSLEGMNHLSHFIQKIFYNPTIMDESAWVQCERCNGSKTSTTENCVITQLPDYLFFNLIRYETLGTETKKVKHDVIADRVLPLKCESTNSEDGDGCTYYLQGIICHKGEDTKTGHYTTYLLEEVNNKMYYHLLNDKKHEVVSNDQFEEVTRTDGYVYLYSKNKHSFFGTNPYSHISMKTIGGQSAFVNGLIRSRSKKQPPRNVKHGRKSDIPLHDSNQISMTSFVTRRNKSSKKESNESTDQMKDGGTSGDRRK